LLAWSAAQFACDAPMKIFTRLAACLALAVTALSAVSASAQTPPGDPVKLRIGFQKSSTLIAILKARGTLERAVAPLNVRIEWGEFASGLPLTEALNAGAVDFSADVADTVDCNTAVAGMISRKSSPLPALTGLHEAAIKLRMPNSDQFVWNPHPGRF